MPHIKTNPEVCQGIDFRVDFLGKTRAPDHYQEKRCLFIIP